MKNLIPFFLLGVLAVVSFAGINTGPSSGGSGGGGGGQPQTPLAQNVNAATFTITNLSGISLRSPGQGGAVFTNETGGAWRINAYDNDGALSSSLFYTLETGGFSFSSGVSISGALDVGGKITGGSIDPLYVLYDVTTRANLKANVLHDVPTNKQNGAALYWNITNHVLEVFVASENKWYSLSGVQITNNVP